MAGCKRCSLAVSRIGPSMPAPSAGTSMATAMGGASNAHIVIVVALTVSGLLCLCMFILILRSHRRASSMSTPTSTGPAEVVSTDHVPTKHGVGDEDSRSKWGAHNVELVVMAGEDRPTFVAHPAAAAAAHVVDCPPLQLIPTSPCRM